MNISYKWLKSFFANPLPQPKELAEILTMHCFENENIVKKGDDYILSLDVLPDRAGDCLCHLGVAKECAAVLNKKIVFPKIVVKEDKKIKAKNLLSVEIKDKKDCKRYIARVLTDVKIGPSPKWMQERLVACGVAAINNVVDATNYVMLEMGQPMHAFDYTKIGGAKIVVRKAKMGEKIMSLSGQTYRLDEKILVIADSERPLALAGIKGGQKAEITCDTKTIVLESANFDAKLVSQTARKLNLRTDASTRFEQNLDPNLAEAAINRAAMLIEKIAGAKIAEGVIDVYPEKVKPKKIKLDLQNLNNILGIDIPATIAVSILNHLGIKILERSSDSLIAEVPTERQDIVIPENLIEEIGRVYGYEKIRPELPCDYLEPVEKNINIFWQDKTKDILKEFGYSETYNYSFIDKSILDIIPSLAKNAIKIKNPVSIDFEYLRPSLIPQLLNNAKENLKTYRDLKIFELNKVFISDGAKLKEERKLSGLTISSSNNTQEIFSKFRGELNLLLDHMGIEKIIYEKTNETGLWDKQAALSVIVKTKKIGTFGQISGEVLEKINLSQRIFAFDFDFEALQKLCSEKKTFDPISFQPAASRDISGFVNTDIENIQIEEALAKALKPLNTKVMKVSAGITDIYLNAAIIGKKSVTINIRLQHSEKTLDTQEINTNINKITKDLSA
ncbi:MAG: phenylalanine--tRNA ligase subunit beta, partial [Candidatus Paceibacterota bacterium]